MSILRTPKSFQAAKNQQKSDNEHTYNRETMEDVVRSKNLTTVKQTRAKRVVN